MGRYLAKNRVQAQAARSDSGNTAERKDHGQQHQRLQQRVGDGDDAPRPEPDGEQAVLQTGFTKYMSFRRMEIKYGLPPIPE